MLHALQNSRSRYIGGVAIAMVLMGLLPTTTLAQGNPSDTVRTQFRFRHQKPSQFILALTETMPGQKTKVSGLPEGLSPAVYVAPILQRPATFLADISLLTPDDGKKRLNVVGTKAAVAEMKKLAGLFDVDVKDMRIEVRVLRPVVGKAAPAVVATATLQAENDKSNRMTLLVEGRPFRVMVTPHRNGDGSARVAVDLSADVINPTDNTVTVVSAVEHIKQVRTQSVLLLPRPGDKKRRPPLLQTEGKSDGLQFELSLVKP